MKRRLMAARRVLRANHGHSDIAVSKADGTVALETRSKTAVDECRGVLPEFGWAENLFGKLRHKPTLVLNCQRLPEAPAFGHDAPDARAHLCNAAVPSIRLEK